MAADRTNALSRFAGPRYAEKIQVILQRKENSLLADALLACDLLRAQGRTNEAKAWADRIEKEPITEKLLRELKSSACERH
jgi:hypothetical protein